MNEIYFDVFEIYVLSDDDILFQKHLYLAFLRTCFHQKGNYSLYLVYSAYSSILRASPTRTLKPSASVRAARSGRVLTSNSGCIGPLDSPDVLFPANCKQAGGGGGLPESGLSPRRTPTPPAHPKPRPDPHLHPSLFSRHPLPPLPTPPLYHPDRPPSPSRTSAASTATPGRHAACPMPPVHTSRTPAAQVPSAHTGVTTSSKCLVKCPC